MILRRATVDDVCSVARLHRLTVQVSLPFLPDLHTPEEDLIFFSTRLFPENTVWVAEVDDAVQGYAAFDADWLNHLFVHPQAQGRGVGNALLGRVVEDRRPRQLWTFQKNVRARRFYEARGWMLVKLTNGEGNEEREPDALYAWRP